MKCKRCDGIGIIDTGNNELPCDCEMGSKARFNVAGVTGDISGAELKRHFLNDSSDPVPLPIHADSLPGRNHS